MARYGFEQCQMITGDHQRVSVRWTGQSGLPRAQANTMLLAEIELSGATLWAFEFLA